VVAGVVGFAVVYRSVLPPRYQEQMLTEVPALSGVFRSLLPPTPMGGTVPTAAAPAGGISPEDLLGAPLAIASSTPALTAEVTAESTESVAVEVVLAPSATPTSLPPTATIPPTVAPTQPPVQPTAEVEQIADSGGAQVPNARMYGFTHVQQGWNNCGPANVTMALSHYGWQGDQDDAASYLRPDDEDKNVSPGEIVNFINEQTGVRAVTRIGGDMELLKAFIANNIPVLVETSASFEGYDWIGHYQTVVAYDDNAGVFYIYDSYLGAGLTGEGITETYAEFDQGWQAFNRVFVAIYESSRESVVQEILGERADLTRAAEIALETAQAEARANRQNPFAWFNIGTALTRLGRYEEAASAYDQARINRLPFRMNWYQFGAFEAYFNTGRYDDLEALINNNLTNGGQYVEETHYWQGRLFEAQGRGGEAADSFRRALQRNPRFVAAQQALNSLTNT
jgi:hypothetical protein